MDIASPALGKNDEAETLPVVCSFWFGSLSWLERTCLASFVAQGHKVDLYSYDRPQGLPDGCRWVDAASIVPRTEMFFYKGNRSPAVFADYFRLMLMRRQAGIWVDCDMVCISPFRDLPEFVFGHEIWPGKSAHAGQINNAVLRLPADSSLLSELIELFEDDGEDRDPIWLPAYRRWEVRVRRLVGQKIGLAHMQFGATGPFPLTYFARMLGLDHWAQPKDVFYPLAYKDAGRMALSGSSFDEVATPRTLGIHLWRMALTDRGRQAVPSLPESGSALFQLSRDLRVALNEE